MSMMNPRIGIVSNNSSTLLSSIAILISNECASKLKRRFTKLRDLIIVITLLYENTLKQSMIDKKIDEKEFEELKKT